MTDTPARKDIIIIKGLPYKDTIRVRDSVTKEGISLAGWTAKSHIRRRQNRRSGLLAEFDISYDDIAAGVMSRSLTDAVTQDIWHGTGWHDLLMTSPGGQEYMWWYGKVSFITRTTQGA